RDGVQTRAIAERLGVSPRQVAAIAAHVTMNTYDTGTQAERSSDSSPPMASQPAVAPPDEPTNSSDDVRILIGTDLESGQPQFWSPTPGSGTPNPHLLIVGESGS